MRGEGQLPVASCQWFVLLIAEVQAAEGELLPEEGALSSEMAGDASQLYGHKGSLAASNCIGSGFPGFHAED